MSLCLLPAYTSFRKARSPHIGAHKMDGLPKASMAELLVTKQDPIHVIGLGKSPTNLEAMSLNYWNIVDLDVI